MERMKRRVAAVVPARQARGSRNVFDPSSGFQACLVWFTMVIANRSLGGVVLLLMLFRLRARPFMVMFGTIQH